PPLWGIIARSRTNDSSRWERPRVCIGMTKEERHIYEDRDRVERWPEEGSPVGLLREGRLLPPRVRYAAGSLQTKREPLPGPPLSARSVPPCASTSARAIVRPMPLRLRAVSVR